MQDTANSIPLTAFSDFPLIGLRPENQPTGQWSDIHASYNIHWSYYKGYVLEEKDEQGRELYPVKLNIVRPSVINHAAVLLGQFEDQRIMSFDLDRSLLSEKEESDKTKQTIRYMNGLWSINDCDSQLMKAALMQQIFGGVFWQTLWYPHRTNYPIQFTAIDPRACFPVFDETNPKRVVQMELQYQIPYPVAVARYGLPPKQAPDLPPRKPFGKPPSYNATSPQYASLVEHWDENEWWVTVDGVTGRYPNGDEMAGENIWYDPVFNRNIVPFAYAPRLDVGQELGESLVTALMSAQIEYNTNIGHMGTLISDVANQIKWYRNVQKPGSLNTNDREEYVNLGMTQFGKDLPEMGRMDPPELSDAMRRMVTEDFPEAAAYTVNTPKVASGNVDASIRSALTLAYMMWPISNVGRHYRVNMASAFKYIFYHASVMANVKRLPAKSMGQNGGVTNVDANTIDSILMAHRSKFPSMLPDDRAALVQEMVQRRASETISEERAVERMDGSEGLEEELNRIDEHREKVAKAAQDLAMASKPVPSDGKGTNNQSKDTSTKAKAAGGRSSSS